MSIIHFWLSRFLGVSILLVLLLWRTDAQVFEGQDQTKSCITDRDCQLRYNSTISTCNSETSTCSNPFRKGCLSARLGGEIRVCNSDDSSGHDCRSPEIKYPEIRIHNANWESSVFMAWINQIILMELAEVPVTVGLTTQETPFASFYNPDNSDMVFSSELYPWDALRRGDQTSNCSGTPLPCVHFLPEVWTGQVDEYWELVEQEIVEPRSQNGMLGQSGLQIPIWVAEKYPELSIWFGWKGEEKRKFLAETFQRPVSWSAYCDKISPFQCQEPDGTATRPPESAEEGARYYVHGFYHGFFHSTEKNNCTTNPNSCSGAIIGPPCSWSSYIEGQLYHNGIVGLEMDGPLEPNGGYSGTQMKEIWHAANATKSPIIMHWYEPDPLPVQFLKSDYELQMVAFPAPTYQCEKSRPSVNDRCSDNVTDRRGDPEGACMNAIQTLSVIIVKSIGENTSETQEANQSPAYETLKNIKVTNLDMNAIWQAWQSGQDPRVALCDWVVENLDQLEEFVPPGYPRQRNEISEYSSWYLWIAQVLGGLVGLVTLIALILCFKFRETKTMVFTQPLFMMLVLCGLLLVSGGALMYALKPSMIVCTVSAWLIVQGYTIELVAVLVKTSAINQLVQSSKKMKRVNIRRNVMLMKVLGVNLAVSACMIAWTANDPPDAVESQELVENDGSVAVEVDLKCASGSVGWRLAAFAWQLILLILAAVLAFQSRHVMEQLNESKSLAMMVYSHFLFVCLRGVTSFFYVYDTLPSSITSALFSLNYSMDALCAMAIYVFPKIWEAWKSPGDYKPGRFSADSKYSSNNKASVDDDNDFSRRLEESFRREEGDNLKLLVCTANIGNAEPTTDSLEAWIPPGGACDHVNQLAGKPNLRGTFDLVAIGMQEATWSDSTRKRSVRVEGQQLTEDEILNALEAKNTATLRELLQETLGDGYCQVADEQRGQMRLHLWAKRAILKDIADVRVSGANTGIGNMLANKGGIIATLYYRNTRISFLTAHLAAHEGVSYYKTRCDNIKSILREAKTFGLSKKFDDSMTAHHMFVFGDLNFRTAFRSESKHDDNVHRASQLIAAKDFESLYLFDELQEGLAEGDLLVDFETLPCNFPPTFKVERAPGFIYKEQRTPSYTDRILFKSAGGLCNNLKPLAYEPCVDFITSDHKPIRGAFSLIPNDAMDVYDLKGDLHIVFRKMRCSDLPAGDSDGKSDPYLMFLWDSVDLQTDNVSLMDKLRELWTGKSWPRTSYISKTLNPYWKGERMHLSTSNTRIGLEAMLFIAAIDFDCVGKDEMLGGVALNVRELIKMQPGKSTKTIHLDHHLTKDGRFAGRIKCKVDVTLNLESNKAETSRMMSMMSLAGALRRSTTSLAKHARPSSNSLSG